MNSKIYVGNIPFGKSEEELRAELKKVFSEFGKLEDENVFLPKERDTGRMRGFGFITFSTQAEAEAAIQGMNGHDFLGRNLRVNMAEERAKGGGGGGGGRHKSGERTGGWR